MIINNRAYVNFLEGHALQSAVVNTDRYDDCKEVEK